MNKLFLCMIVILQLTSIKLAHASQEDNPCQDVMRHAIYDTYQDNSYSGATSDFRTRLCDSYESYKHDRDEGKLRAGFLSIFGGSGSHSKESMESVSTLMCTETILNTEQLNFVSIDNQYVSANGLAAYNTCVQINSFGLKVKRDIREDTGHITISIHYVADIGTPPELFISGVYLSPPNSFNCYGPLWNFSEEPGTIGTEVVSLTCDRIFAATPFSYFDKQVYAVPSSIIIMTNTATVTTDFTAKYA